MIPKLIIRKQREEYIEWMTAKNESPGQQNSEDFNLELLYSQLSVHSAHPSSPDEYEGARFIMPPEP